MIGCFIQPPITNVLRLKMGHFLSCLDAYLEKGMVNAKLYHLIRTFYDNYQQALAQSSQQEKGQQLFELLIKLIIEQIQYPYQFSIFHRCIRQPFDYYQFGLDFIRPFIDFSHSRIFGLDMLKSIREQLKKGENVILLANHQTEPDPQVISLLLEKIDSKLAVDMIFIAGHRVISDPMAIPMSLGRNLLCIYSKKHMAYPPEEKAKKVLHNQRTLKQMQELLNEGGYCIYVAPSGGRDRPNAAGEVTVAPFDPQSIELFWLLGQQTERSTHFYPLALQTFHLMPPPRQVEKELGEQRIINFTPVYLAFGEEIDMENFPGSEHLDKRAKRNQRAEYIWQQVCQNYRAFPVNLSRSSNGLNSNLGH
jgi:glycerol-3-phosphate O-acyltransferase